MTGTLARHGRTEAVSGAGCDAVWRVIADVTRVGEWSHECRAAHLAGGARAAAPGVRFRGWNRSGLLRWTRSCVFTVVDPPRQLVWRTGGLWGRADRTEWRITLEPVPEGTRIVQTYDVFHVAPGLDRVYWLLVRGHRDRREALAQDLRRLAALAEGNGATPGSGAVTGLKHRLTRAGNRIGVWMYRTLDGRLSSGSARVHVLMITTPGRRTGIPRSTCVRYLDDGDGFVVWGTGSGSARDPDWFRNLRRAELAEIQVRADRLQVRPRELVGQERDAMWNEVVLAQAPEVEKYARRAGRTIPVAVLVPVDSHSPRATR